MNTYTELLKNGGNLPIGVDDGYDEVKVVLPDGECLRIPSHAKSGIDSSISFGNEEKTIFSYKVEGKDYVAGKILEHDNTASDDYPISNLNKVVVMHALRKASLSEKHKLHICTGLPLKKFYKRGKPNADLIKRKMENLKSKNITSQDDYSLPEIVNHQVLAEGLAAWFDYITYFNSDGRIERHNDKYQQRIAVIDIGGRTTDIVVIKNGAIDYERSSTIDAGMLNIKEEVRELIRDELEVEINNEQMHTAINEGKVKLWGEWEDVQDIVARAESIITTRIESEAKHKLKNASDIDVVLFVGGTVNKIKGKIYNWFRTQVIVEQPGFANARGMQKYAQMLLESE
ncbi:ParM/StbA family protein [Pseudoalteromonas sp. OFAV1]|uniref:ParM/StbA family protein n=1 Tax=Pseudoalteromonas sp. OFAV1 TaxID=2908892 RepID=UPI001F1D1865|nr:ParM/StbA family protein [Pseudoalteromonas sp. OFAV1]MCF2900975.1 ParM/StbA family protein [Pseudoalteromonas sp. OFAV1]